MPRAVDGTRRRKRRQKLHQITKGYFGGRRNLFRAAKDQAGRSLAYAYRDRKNKKRVFRALWITRISALCRQHGLPYSRFVQGLQAADIRIDRKALSNLAIEDPKAFAVLVEQARAGLQSAKT